MSWQAESPGSDWQQTLPWSSLVGLHFSDFWSHWQKIFWGLPAWHALWDKWSQRWSIQHTASVTLPWQLKSGWRRSSIHSSAVEVDTNRKVKTAKLDLLHILPRRLFHVDCKKMGFRWQQWDWEHSISGRLSLNFETESDFYKSLKERLRKSPTKCYVLFLLFVNKSAAFCLKLTKLRWRRPPL